MRVVFIFSKREPQSVFSLLYNIHNISCDIIKSEFPIETSTYKNIFGFQ